MVTTDQDPRDAEDSVKELDGTELCGMLARWAGWCSQGAWWGRWWMVHSKWWSEWCLVNGEWCTVTRVEMAKDKEERRQLAGERQLRLEMEKRKRRLEERREEEERKWREEERREEEERKERGRYSHRRSREKEGRSSREDGKHRCRNENTTRKKRRSRSKEDRGSSKDSKSRSKEGICDIKEYKYKRQEVEGKARDRAAEIGGTSGGNRDGKPKNQDEEVLKKKTKPKDIEFKANKKVKIDEAAAEREMEDGELEDTSDEDPYADQNKFR